MYNKEQRREYERQYMEKHRDEINARRRERRAFMSLEDKKKESATKNRCRTAKLSQYKEVNSKAKANWIASMSDEEVIVFRKRNAEMSRRRVTNNPIKARLSAIKSRAKNAGVAFNLTEEWFLAHFSQGCEFTGKDFSLDSSSPWYAEIDRIKPGGDYTMDNCRIVCAIYNRARLAWPDSVVSEFCHLVIGNEAQFLHV